MESNIIRAVGIPKATFRVYDTDSGYTSINWPNIWYMLSIYPEATYKAYGTSCRYTFNQLTEHIIHLGTPPEHMLHPVGTPPK